MEKFKRAYLEYKGRFAEGHSVFNLKLNAVIRIAQTEADETLY